MRRALLVLLASLTLASAAEAKPPTVRQERARQRAVLTRVAEINTKLDAVVEQWNGARVQLADVRSRMRANERVLRIARQNLNVAQHRLALRLRLLYVDPSPGVVAVIAGATSLSDAVDRLESLRLVATQDAALAHDTTRFTRQVSLREHALRRERRQSVETVQRLSAQHATIDRQLAQERRLLASIHESIQTLVARAAARARARAARDRARIAREVAAAKARAAAETIARAANPVPAPPQPAQPAPAAAATPTPPATPAPAPAPAVPPVPVPAPAPSAAHAEAAAIAARYLGVPYVWGGASPGGFDCSGLVTYVYAQLGVSLPHYTVSQWNATTPIAASELQPGDLVFFDGLGHVGIYIGGGQFIHAPHTGTVVQVAALSGYWAAHLDGARRVP